MKKVLNTAIIGYGMAGSVFHCPIISSLDGFQLNMIYTRNEDCIQRIKKLYPGTKPVSDVKEILSDETIDLVVIASPNTYHFSLAKEAILAGKHIVIDKPFTVHSTEAEELISLAQKHSRMMSVFQNRRWDSDFRTVKQVIGSGILGNLVECEIHMDRYRNVIKDRAWRADFTLRQSKSDLKIWHVG
ncbi:MAG: oxidoreductase domain protein [Clostridia bacterium]|nr:oxidoreductase domain protein [Clostridia bacterium]